MLADVAMHDENGFRALADKAKTALAERDMKSDPELLPMEPADPEADSLSLEDRVIQAVQLVSRLRQDKEALQEEKEVLLLEKQAVEKKLTETEEQLTGLPGRNRFAAGRPQRRSAAGSRSCSARSTSSAERRQ
ncbi:MAG: hypothetical protein IPM24_16865 [Bryobacterales bacterium]|nr:hypothetical protein [Bryobacterales bacterium]